MAAKDLTTLAKLKAWVGITDVNSDALLADLITRASSYVTSFLDRELVSASYTDTANGNGRVRIRTRQWPISAVSGVTISGNAIALSPDGRQNGYTFDGKYIYLCGGLIFEGGLRNVSISYTAGYTAIPEEIEMAVIELCSKRYKGRQRIGLTSETLNGMATAFSQKDLSDDMLSILDNYQRKFLAA